MTREWTEVVGAIGLFVLIIGVVVVTVWQVGATWRAKVLVSREEAYRSLAETSVRTQENVDRTLSDLTDRLADVDTRLRNVERILKEVE